MDDALVYEYKVNDGDFQRAGEVSSDIKKKLKAMGVPQDVIRKVAIAMYEGEVNMIIHANGGNITVTITPSGIKMVLADGGPGIADIDKAMQAGYSTARDEIRNLGFGAGMGLPNMKKNTDRMNIETEIGKGTTITMELDI